MSPDTPVSSTNKIDRHDITEIHFWIVESVVKHHKTTYSRIIMWWFLSHSPNFKILVSMIYIDFLNLQLLHQISQQILPSGDIAGQ